MRTFQNKTADKVNFKVWDLVKSPRRILIIRFHAIGDVAACLPACKGLREIFPECRIDLLTGNESKELAERAGIFDNVYDIAFTRNKENLLYRIKRKASIVQTALELKKNRYDVLIDLQHNSNSLIVRKTINPQFFAEFNRFSPKAHSARVLETFHSAGFKDVKENFEIKNDETNLTRANELLNQYGRIKGKTLAVLNPAGLWKTRNWPLENYKKLGDMLIQDLNAQLVFIGDERIKDKTEKLKAHFKENAIDIAGKTSLSEAFAVLSLCDAIVTEDSALYHMAWALGLKGVLMLGSTRSDWTSHTTGNIISLNSNDLDCGNCMQAECKYGDVRCLTRYSPQFIYEKVRGLLV